MPETPERFTIGTLLNQTVGPIIASVAGTIAAPTHNIHHVSGALAIVTIPVPWPGFTGRVTFIPDAGFTWTAAGNIALAGSAVVNKALDMVYDGTKWNPSYIA
jgi:hypothetical protein